MIWGKRHSQILYPKRGPQNPPVLQMRDPQPPPKFEPPKLGGEGKKKPAFLRGVDPKSPNFGGFYKPQTFTIWGVGRFQTSKSPNLRSEFPKIPHFRGPQEVTISEGVQNLKFWVLSKP